jgi:kynurenine formamidase
MTIEELFEIEFMGINFEVVDLSQEIYQGMPVFPGHQRTIYWPHVTHEETKGRFTTIGSYETHNLLISEHGSTHTDAFFEGYEKGLTIDKMPLKYFIGKAICLDLSNVPERQFITKADLQDSLSRSGLEIKKDDIVLLYTGNFERRYGTKGYVQDHSGLDLEASRWLVKQGVINVGIDAPTIDNPADKNFGGHVGCIESQTMTNTENLGNIKKVVGKRFLYVGLPLRIRGGTGSPIRAVGLVPKK